MAAATGSNWKSKALVAGVVGLICAAIYPVVVVPLQIAYGGAERPERDPRLAPGFRKQGMWAHIEGASKQNQGGAPGGDSPAQQQQQQRR